MRSSIVLFLGGILSLSGLSAIQASTVISGVSDSLYTSLASDSAYSGVGQLYESASDGTYCGSATLVSSEWVLTAAHMVTSADSASDITFVINGTTYTADSYTYYSGYDSTTLSGDLALVHLSTAVTDSSVTYATLYSGTTSSLLGQTATYVGYGCTGTGLTGYDSSTYGTKRAVQNVLDCLASSVESTWSSSDLISDFDSPASSSNNDGFRFRRLSGGGYAYVGGKGNNGRGNNGPGNGNNGPGKGNQGSDDDLYNTADNVTGSSTALALEGLIAPGDSGGGVFVTIDGVTYLVGVNSFIASVDGDTDADYGDLCGCVSVCDYSSWISSVMSTSFDAALVTVPEPASLGLLAVAGLAMVLRFRRRS